MTSSFSLSKDVKGKVIDVQLYIAQCAVLSHNILFATDPKPGGASFSKPFTDTCTSDFLIGGSNLFQPLFELSKRGILVAQNHLWYDDAEIGYFIKKGLSVSRDWSFKTGNTILGTILMLSPLSVSIANFYANEGMRTSTPLDFDVIMKVHEHFLKHSSKTDCTYLTEALNESVSANLLPSKKDEDNFDSFLKIHEFENTNLFEFTKFYENRDLVFSELANKYQTTLKHGYKFFKETHEKTNNLMLSVTQTYLKLLSTKKDTHIAKRFGNEIASEVNKKAQEIMKNGGIFSKDGLQLAESLDDYLRTSKDRIINPGSIADLAAATIFLALLDGYRP